MLWAIPSDLPHHALPADLAGARRLSLGTLCARNPTKTEKLVVMDAPVPGIPSWDVLVVIPYDDIEDAIRIANDSPYGLTGAVWTSDREAGLAVARLIRAGFLNINAQGPDFLAPFGGFMRSGIGRELGTVGLGEYAELKAITL
jgi:Aldehyde dehydrogenase family